jgi:hypothetical protein
MYCRVRRHAFSVRARIFSTHSVGMQAYDNDSNVQRLVSLISLLLLLLLLLVHLQVRKFVILTGDTKEHVLCEALDITSHAVRKHLTAMATDGLLRKSSQGRYVLSTRYVTELVAIWCAVVLLQCIDTAF